jgi:hypothetical protein
MRGGGGIILALIVASVVALLYAPLFLKASQELRSYRPDAFRSSSYDELSGIGAPSNRWGGDLKGRGHPSRHANKEAIARSHDGASTR